MKYLNITDMQLLSARVTWCNLCFEMCCFIRNAQMVNYIWDCNM